MLEPLGVLEVIVTVNLPPLEPLELDTAKPPTGVSRVAWANKLRGVERLHARHDYMVIYTLAQMGVLTPYDAARALHHSVLEHRRERNKPDPGLSSVEQFRQMVEHYVATYVPPRPRVKGLWDYVLARGW